MSHRISNVCNGCTVCGNLCPVFAISGEENVKHTINEKRCIDCGICGRVCDSGAVSDENGKTCKFINRSLWHKPVVNKKICSACSICVHNCVFGAMRISPPKNHGEINAFAEYEEFKVCIGCAICESRCPTGAIVMESV